MKKFGDLKYLKKSWTMRHFYFNRTVLLINSMPLIDISQSFCIIRRQVMSLSWMHFNSIFNADIRCIFHLECPYYYFNANYRRNKRPGPIEGFHSVIKSLHNCYEFVVRHVGVHAVLWHLKSCRASRRILTH